MMLKKTLLLITCFIYPALAMAAFSEDEEFSSSENGGSHLSSPPRNVSPPSIFSSPKTSNGTLPVFFESDDSGDEEEKKDSLAFFPPAAEVSPPSNNLFGMPFSFPHQDYSSDSEELLFQSKNVKVHHRDDEESKDSPSPLVSLGLRSQQSPQNLSKTNQSQEK